MISAFYCDFEEKQVKTLIKSVCSVYVPGGKVRVLFCLLQPIGAGGLYTRLYSNLSYPQSGG